jgi:hypothetical protein
MPVQDARRESANLDLVPESFWELERTLVRRELVFCFSFI